MPASLIFDMDDTLVATAALWREAETKLLENLGQRWSPELASNYKGMNALDVAATIHRLLSPQLSVKNCQDMMRDALFKAFQKGPICPMAGAIACVRSFAKSYPLAIASGSPLPLIELAIQRLGIEDQFQVIVSSESVARGKPSPDIFLAAAKRLRVPVSDCLVFEDSLIGTQAAIAAGMTCFTIPSSNSCDIAKIAHRTYSSLADVRPADLILFGNDCTKS